MARANRKPDYLAKNPSGSSPALELDDESVLCGNPRSANTWRNASPLRPCSAAPRRSGPRHTCGHAASISAFAKPLATDSALAKACRCSKAACSAEAADGLKAIAKDKLLWLDGLLGDKTFVCGDPFHLADIMLCFLLFGASVGQPLEDCQIAAWLAHVGARPSASA